MIDRFDGNMREILEHPDVIYRRNSDRLFCFVIDNPLDKEIVNAIKGYRIICVIDRLDKFSSQFYHPDLLT